MVAGATKREDRKNNHEEGKKMGAMPIKLILSLQIITNLQLEDPREFAGPVLKMSPPIPVALDGAC